MQPKWNLGPRETGLHYSGRQGVPVTRLRRLYVLRTGTSLVGRPNTGWVLRGDPRSLHHVLENAHETLK